MKTDASDFEADLEAKKLKVVSDATEFLLEQANRTVPIEEATLKGSGTATVEASGTKVRGVVAYDTPYAVRQHEDTRLKHDEGRRAKWLELTAQEQATDIEEFIAAGLREVAS